MVAIPQIRTGRLLLREWRDEDLEPFSRLNADPQVMAHFPELLTRELSDHMVARVRAHFERRGFGFWAVEVPGVAPFIGFIGLGVPRYTAHFTPCVEIGWRLAAEHWGKGYAPEGAKAVLAFGFESLGLREIIAVVVPGNEKSRRVMDKLGMRLSAGDEFDHPLVDEGKPGRRHVLYRLRRDQFQP